MSGPDLTLFDQAPSDGAWSVSRLTRTAKLVLENQLGPIWIQGEVVGLKQYRSGHWYFTLQDPEAQVRCVVWRDDARQIRTAPEDGARVYAFGAPTLWAERGEFRFTIKQLIPTEGLGLQQALLERTKAALQADGLFDVARKRPIPALAMSIAVVTSLDGAAVHDVVSVARKRWPLARIVVIGARVQGGDAEHEVARALEMVNRLDGIDVCIVGRGGGAREDLVVFNAERVCRALAEVSVPTISAVGHETDISLTDLVADARAATPSAAAELAVPDRSDVLRHLDALATRMGTGLGGRAQIASERLGRVADRMQGAVTRTLDARRGQLERLGTALDALSPLKVLQRGYSMAVSPEGHVLKTKDAFHPGDRFRLRVTDGDVEARVEAE